MDREDIERVLTQHFNAHIATYDLALRHRFYKTSRDIPEAERLVLDVLINITSSLGLRELESEFFSRLLKVEEEQEENRGAEAGT